MTPKQTAKLTKEQDFVLGKLNKAIPCDHEIKFSDIDGDVIENLLAQAILQERSRCAQIVEMWMEDDEHWKPIVREKINKGEI